MMADQGIWKYREKLQPLPVKYHLSLSEGGTELRYEGGIFFKCEFENPNGSFKDRSLAFQISRIYSQGIRKAVISSSGNAAISASSYCQMADIDLQVFVSPNINLQKKEILEKNGIKFNISATPIRSAFQYAKKTGAYNLRGSTDQNALEGYKTIAYEILEEIKPDAVFVPVSSGTAFVGIARGFQDMGKMPDMHAVQSSYIHPIAADFDTDFQKTDKSLADAIIARYTPRQKEINDIISESNGNGWVISDMQIINAVEELKSYGIFCSFEGAMALAAYRKAKQKGQIYKNPVCILSGKIFKVN